MYVSQCIGKDCTWWLPYANDCALPVVAGILADSTICQNAFETEEPDNETVGERKDGDGNG